MSSVWLSRFSRAYEALVNAKGGPVLVDIDPALRIVAVIQEGNEDRYLQGWNRYGFNVLQAAVAAQFGTVRFRNPPASNVVCVVESLVYTTAGGAQDQPNLTWGATVSDLATIPALSFSRIDPRGQPQPTAILSSTTQGSGNLAIFALLNQPANTSVQFVQTHNQEYTVLPGQILQVFSATVNLALNASWLWRERALQQSELT